MKALEKDRTRRYDTAGDLAADVRRHLKHEPVAARPPHPFYRLQKLVRRNRTLFAAAVAVSVSLTGGAVVSTWQYFRAQEARESERQLRLQMEQIRRELGPRPESGPGAARGRWGWESPSPADFSPLFHQTLAEHLEECLQQNTVEALDEAARLAAGNPGYARRISEARRRLEPTTGRPPTGAPAPDR